MGKLKMKSEKWKVCEAKSENRLSASPTLRERGLEMGLDGSVG